MCVCITVARGARWCSQWGSVIRTKKSTFWRSVKSEPTKNGISLLSSSIGPTLRVVVFCAHFAKPIISHTGERINPKQMVTHNYPIIGAKSSIRDSFLKNQWSNKKYRLIRNLSQNRTTSNRVGTSFAFRPFTMGDSWLSRNCVSKTGECKHCWKNSPTTCADN